MKKQDKIDLIQRGIDETIIYRCYEEYWQRYLER